MSYSVYVYVSDYLHGYIIYIYCKKLILELHKQPEPKSYFMTDNSQNICEGVTTDGFWEAGGSQFSGYYIYKIKVVIPYKQV